MEAHRSVWPELLAALRDAGIRNYTIFRAGSEMFGYFEADDLDGAERFLGAQEVSRRWQDAMAELLDQRVPDGGPPHSRRSSGSTERRILQRQRFRFLRPLVDLRAGPAGGCAVVSLRRAARFGASGISPCWPAACMIGATFAWGQAGKGTLRLPRASLVCRTVGASGWRSRAPGSPVRVRRSPDARTTASGAAPSRGRPRSAQVASPGNSTQQARQAKQHEQRAEDDERSPDEPVHGGAWYPLESAALTWHDRRVALRRHGGHRTRQRSRCRLSLASPSASASPSAWAQPRWCGSTWGEATWARSSRIRGSRLRSTRISTTCACSPTWPRSRAGCPRARSGSVASSRRTPAASLRVVWSWADRPPATSSSRRRSRPRPRRASTACSTGSSDKGYLRELNASSRPAAFATALAAIPEGFFVRIAGCRLRVPTYVQMNEIITDARTTISADRAWTTAVYGTDEEIAASDIAKVEQRGDERSFRHRAVPAHARGPASADARGEEVRPRDRPQPAGPALLLCRHPRGALQAGSALSGRARRPHHGAQPPGRAGDDRRQGRQTGPASCRRVRGPQRGCGIHQRRRRHGRRADRRFLR